MSARWSRASKRRSGGWGRCESWWKGIILEKGIQAALNQARDITGSLLRGNDELTEITDQMHEFCRLFSVLRTWKDTPPHWNRPSAPSPAFCLTAPTGCSGRLHDLNLAEMLNRVD